MNKSEFLRELEQYLSPVSEEDRLKALDFYAEMIDDRIEDGMSEEEAVSAMGDAAQIARDALSELNAVLLRKSSSSGCAAQSFSAPLTGIFAKCADADLTVRQESLPEGVAARVEFPSGNARDFACEIENGALYITCTPSRKLESLLFGRHGLPRSCILTIAQDAPEQLELESRSGDIHAEYVAVPGNLFLSTLSGDLHAAALSVNGELTLSTTSGDLNACGLSANALSLSSVSGDLTLSDLNMSGALEIGVSSGDIDLKSLTIHGSLSVNTSSGDVTLSQLAASAINISSSSGDIDVHQTSAAGPVQLQSSSGDIELSDLSADRIDISSSSGDVSGTLYGDASFYAITASTTSGDISIPSSCGKHPVKVNTTSGDIDLSLRS